MYGCVTSPQVAYKNNTKLPTYSDGSLLARTDIQHAKEVSKLASQVKYKESFDRQVKGQKPCYNPLDCVSFKHTQAAAALASQVREALRWTHRGTNRPFKNRNRLKQEMIFCGEAETQPKVIVDNLWE